MTEHRFYYERLPYSFVVGGYYHGARWHVGFSLAFVLHLMGGFWFELWRWGLDISAAIPLLSLEISVSELGDGAAFTRLFEQALDAEEGAEEAKC